MNGAFNPQFASFQFFYATPRIKFTPTRHTHAMPPSATHKADPDFNNNKMCAKGALESIAE